MNVFIRSWLQPDMKFRAEPDIDGNIIRIGQAPPNTPDDAPLWRIKELTYLNGTPIAGDFPQKDGVETDGPYFVWDLRNTYTYGAA